MLTSFEFVRLGTFASRVVCEILGVPDDAVLHRDTVLRCWVVWL